MPWVVMIQSVGGIKREAAEFVKRIHWIWVTALVTVVVWAAMTWPLPTYVHRGIPASSYGRDEAAPRHMIAGDHLQLLYRFWLVHDMLRGRTPLFNNVYEFNDGNDNARYRPGAYYAPFSLLYAGLAALGGPAVGWNLTALVALWLTYLCTCALVLPYTRSRFLAMAAALPCIALPYRYYVMLGGSPGGLAMLWPPMALLGMDWAMRRFSVRGSLLAAVAFLFAGFTDVQVFFFMVLASPAWLFWVALHSGNWRRIHRQSPGRLTALAALPLLALAGAYVYLQALQSTISQSAHMAGGRAIGEVLLFSPKARALFSLAPPGGGGQTVYLGYAFMGLLALGLAVTAYAALPLRTQKSHWQPLAALGLAAVAVAGTACLALGPNGALEGALFTFARRLIPPYRMLRQSSKIFCLLPPLMALGAAGAAEALRDYVGRHVAVPLVAACCLFGAWEYGRQVDPVICLLADRQDAYRAVVEDTLPGNAPRAVAIPLWPGDTHWGSLSEYYGGMLHRIRMLNGYSPVVDADYYNNVFSRFRSLNAGQASGEQLDALRARGIRHLLLHEDAFPEKVNAFPVARTLHSFLRHPRLELLHQADRVWAFRILATAGSAEPVPAASAPVYFPARYFDFERYPENAAGVHEDPLCSGSGFVRLAATRPMAVTRPAGMGSQGDEQWRLRLRGVGAVRLHLVDTRADDAPVWDSGTINVSTLEWQWISVPVESTWPYRTIRMQVECLEGAVDVDAAFFLAGDWTPPAPGATLALAAPWFFHAGYTDMQRQAVVIRHDWEPAGRIFYGPRLPLEPGAYRVTLEHEAKAAPGTRVGTWMVEAPPDVAGSRVDVIAGLPAVLRIEPGVDRYALFSFRYNGAADIDILRVVIERESGDR